MNQNMKSVNYLLGTMQLKIKCTAAVKLCSSIDAKVLFILLLKPSGHFTKMDNLACYEFKKKRKNYVAFNI